MIVSQTVHVLKVCGTVMPKYSFTSQKPPSFTCERISEPAPAASTSEIPAVGVGSLPGNITVEIEAIVAIHD